jgi:hypothetical protein
MSFFVNWTFFSSMIIFLSRGGIYVYCSNFNTHGVGKMCVTCGTWFLSVKAQNFSIVFRFSRKELGSKTVFKGQNQKFDEGF